MESAEHEEDHQHHEYQGPPGEDTTVELDDYVPYVSVKQRKQEQLRRLLQQRSSTGVSSSGEDSDSPSALLLPRRKRTRLDRELAAAEEPQVTEGPMAKVSLIEQTVEIQKTQPPKSEEEKLREEEQQILDALIQRKKLQSDYELAKGGFSWCVRASSTHHHQLLIIPDY